MTEFNVSKEDCGLTTTYADWLGRKNAGAAFEHEHEHDDVEGDLVTRILSLDFTHWVMRRTAGTAIDGGNSDCVRRMRNELVCEYAEKFSRPYDDPNEGLTW